MRRTPIIVIALAYLILTGALGFKYGSWGLFMGVYLSITAVALYALFSALKSKWF